MRRIAGDLGDQFLRDGERGLDRPLVPFDAFGKRMDGAEQVDRGIRIRDLPQAGTRSDGCLGRSRGGRNVGFGQRGAALQRQPERGEAGERRADRDAVHAV